MGVGAVSPFAITCALRRLNLLGSFSNFLTYSVDLRDMIAMWHGILVHLGEIMKLKLSITLLAVALSGCQAIPIASSPRSIVMNGVNNASIQDAFLKAQVHCSQFNRDAELVPDDVADGRATFRCVDKNSAPS